MLFQTRPPLDTLKRAHAEQRPTTVELQLVVEVVQLLLDVGGTRTVFASAERQQHVDLKYEKTIKINFLSRAAGQDPGFIELYWFSLLLNWWFLLFRVNGLDWWVP